MGTSSINERGITLSLINLAYPYHYKNNQYIKYRKLTKIQLSRSNGSKVGKMSKMTKGHNFVKIGKLKIQNHIYIFRSL